MGDGIPAELAEGFNRHRKLEEIIFSDVPMSDKQEAMRQIKEQSALFRRQFAGLDAEAKKVVQDHVLNAGADMPLLNLCDFATQTGVAFSVNCLPYRCISSYVVPRRMRQISVIESTPIAWHLYSADVSDIYSFDSSYDFFAGSQQYASRKEIAEGSVKEMDGNILWSNAALAYASGIDEVNYIYSRSNPIASHLPAFEFKKQHSGAVWYAEFSDHPAINYLGEKRYYPQERIGDVEYSENYYENLEMAVYDAADKLIFTNENQRQYALGKCGSKAGRESIRKKGIVLHHPIPDPRLKKICRVESNTPADRINIAYFGGVFNEVRKLDSFFELARAPEVLLHIYAPKGRVGQYAGASPRLSVEDLLDAHRDVAEKVVLEEHVDHLDFLCIASLMDYLYVEDPIIRYGINPFLPSKLADYLSTGTPIIAKVQPGSAMSAIEQAGVIKITEVTDAFLRSLRKKGRELQ
jgi:hypothetical protein